MRRSFLGVNKQAVDLGQREEHQQMCRTMEEHGLRLAGKDEAGKTGKLSYPGLNSIPLNFPSTWTLRVQPHLETGSLQTSLVKMRSCRIQ